MEATKRKLGANETDYSNECKASCLIVPQSRMQAYIAKSSMLYCSAESSDIMLITAFVRIPFECTVIM